MIFHFTEQIQNWMPLEQGERIVIFDITDLAKQPYFPDVVYYDYDMGLLFYPDTTHLGASTFLISRMFLDEHSSRVMYGSGIELQQALQSNLTFQWFIEEPTIRIASIFPTSAEISVLN